MLSIEILFPNLIPSYPSETSRIIDIYVNLCMFIVIIIIISISAKNNYMVQYELAQQSDRLKTSFLQNMSHEVRTPLNAIVGFSRVITSRDLPKEKKEAYVDLISENSDYLTKLMNDIIDISMIESGVMTMNYDTINYSEIVRAQFKIYEQILKAKDKSHIKFTLDMPSADIVGRNDVHRYTQILTNILNNAVKFTFDGEITIGLSRNSNSIVCYVKDTGCGVSPLLKEKIFERFIKTDDEINQEINRGAGIGLALAHQLSVLLGGTIWYDSKIDCGSIFYFTIPDKTVSTETVNLAQLEKN